ncbi:hypothetical protein UYSO10_1606 [Kosakonia radicincitans]|nr:hypothetical protein UYSO10_1606 [Kosakonia radicincitans]
MFIFYGRNGGLEGLWFTEQIMHNFSARNALKREGLPGGVGAYRLTLLAVALAR